MGQGNSQLLFVHMLKNVLRVRGAKVGQQQLTKFLQFVEEVCPWFPEEGTVDLETWKRVGQKLQDYYDAHGPSKVPVDTFGLWTLIRDCLDPRHERTQWQEQGKDAFTGPEAPPNPDIAPTAPPPPFTSLFFDENEEPLDPGDTAQLGDETAKYHEEEEVEQLKQKLANLSLQMQKLAMGPQPLKVPIFKVPQDPPRSGGRLTPTIIAGLDPPPVSFAPVGPTGTPLWINQKPMPQTGLQQGLQQAASRLLGNLEASSLLVKQLAYENANSAYQTTIRTFRKKGDLSDYVRLCSDIGLSYMKGLAVTAALLGKSMREMLSDWSNKHGKKMP